MSVRNRTRRTVLGKTLLTLNRHFRRTLRYINRTGIPAGCALWITPCHGIYTVGNSKPVDIAFLNGEGRVVKMLRNFPPDCYADSVPAAVSALELPADVLAETGTRIGDDLEFDIE